MVRKNLPRKDDMKATKIDIIMQNKVFARIAVATGVILLIPLVAMQFTDEVKWGLPDFIVIGILLFGMGFLYVHIARVVPRKYRTLIGVACIITLLYIWAELAVGIFTNIGS